jgi:dihydrofolate synthase / folylpolyglutamate synthase
MNNTYKKIKEDLTSKDKFHIKLGLERVSEILNLLDNPQNKIKTIHIAGTNGKGSTSAMLAKVLEKSGYKVGIYTSPHLIKYNERIKISSQDISDADFSSLLKKVNTLAKKNKLPLTEFEALTIVAFLYFEQERTDIAIIEVGLGGRLDATNVINPILEIITSISFDHTERLGDSLEKIAAEKAGIIKKNSTVIVNANNKGLNIIKKTAQNMNTEVKIAAEPNYVIFKNGINEIKIDERIYKTNLFGNFQGDNLSLVITALDFLKEKGFEIKNQADALLNIYWPARMQFIKENVILDGAHNPSAAKVLRETLDKNFPNQKRIWFFGALKNKDFKKNIEILFSPEDLVYFVSFDAPNSCLYPDFIKVYSSKSAFFIDIMQFLTIYDNIKSNNTLVIICGSLYLAGQILALVDSKQ